MKIKLLILLFCLMPVGQAYSHGQQKSKDKKKPDVKELTASIDSLQHTIDSLRTCLAFSDSLSLAHQTVLDSMLNTINGLSAGHNAIVNSLKDSLTREISDRDKEILSLKSNIGFVDTCMVKLANRWLYEPFDKESVSEAITYFDRIYSSRLKEELSIVQKLLREYEPAYNEFINILKRAQLDPERKSPFAVDEYKEKYSRKICEMRYYYTYYESDWNIRYLNEQIQKAIEILENHSDEKPADFSYLIDLNRLTSKET